MTLADRALASLSYPLEAAVHAALVALAAVVPFRDDDLWVFGAREGAGFADNPRYLFVHVADAHPEVRAVWLSRDRTTIRRLQERGYEAYHVWSPAGVALSLRAGVAVLSHSTRDVNRWLVGGATLAVLWHGVPLKTIGWDAELPDLPRLARIGLRRVLGRYDLVTVPGPDAVGSLASGLGLDRERFAVTGYPRNDALVGAFDDDPGVSDDLADADALARLRGIDGQVVLYLPTFREEGIRASDRLNLDALAGTLDDLNATLVVKLHPSEEFTDASAGAEGSDRVAVLPSDVDVHPLLAATDALVTDYSSIYFDYLLLDRPVVFFPYDRERYGATRGFYFEYDAVTPGPVAETDEELAVSLRTALESDPHADERAALRERFVREVAPGVRSEAAFRAVRDRQDRRVVRERQGRRIGDGQRGP